MKNNIRLTLIKENGNLSINVVLVTMDTYTVNKITFNPCSIFSFTISRGDKNTLTINHSDKMYKLRNDARNKLISFFSNTDIFNALPNNILLTVLLDTPTPYIEKTINSNNDIVMFIKIAMPCFDSWKFFDNNKSVYRLNIEKLFIKDRTVTCVKVPERRLINRFGNYTEVSDRDANLHALAHDIKGNTQTYFLKLTDDIGIHINNIETTLYNFILSGPNGFMIKLPKNIFEKYITKNLFYQDNGEQVFYKLSYV